MPKLKTHSGTKDRVRISKNRKVRVGSANLNHFLSKKSGSRKRALKGLHTRKGSFAKNVRQNLGV
jgi:large subunit ribosomal protein L35